MGSLISQFIAEDLRENRQIKAEFKQKCSTRKKKFSRKEYVWKGVERLKLYLTEKGLASWRDEYLHPYQCFTCNHWHIGHSDSLHRINV